MHVSIHPPSIYTHTHNDPFSQSQFLRPLTYTRQMSSRCWPTSAKLCEKIRLNNLEANVCDTGPLVEMLSSNFFNQYIASASANTMVHWGTLMVWPLHLVKIKPAYQHVLKLFPLGQRWARHASTHFTNRGSKSPNDPPNCFQARLGSALCTC